MEHDKTGIDILSALSGYEHRSEIPFVTNLYVIYSSSGYYKIGITKKPKERIKRINRGALTPFHNQYIFLIPYSHEVAKLAEIKLHKKFNHKRINGEWFKLDPIDLAFIAKLQAYNGSYWLEKVQEDNGATSSQDSMELQHG